MSETFAFLTKAKKKSGKPDMMFWCSANNERIARSKLSIALDAAGLDEADYFNPQRTHLPVVDDLPAEETLSSDFCRHYQMVDNDWVRRQAPLPAPQEEASVVSQMSPMPDTPAPTQEEQAPDETRLDFWQLPLEQRAALVQLYGPRDYYLDDLPTALEILNAEGEIYSGNYHMAVAIGKCSELAQRDAAGLDALIMQIQQRYNHMIPHWPELVTFIRQHRTDNAEPLTPANDATSETPIMLAPGRPFDPAFLRHTIACALQPANGYDLLDPEPTIVARAQQLMADNDKALAIWYKLLTDTPGIWEVHPDDIFAMIQAAPESIAWDEDATRCFIDENLGVIQPVPRRNHAQDTAPTREATPDNMAALFAASPLASLPPESAPDTATPTQEQDKKQEQVTPPRFEPGRYPGLSSADYHAANGISSTMLKDARISLMYFHGRHIAKTIPRQESPALLLGALIHTLALEPEKFTAEYALEPQLPPDVFTSSESMKKAIEAHNATLPAPLSTEQLKAHLLAHNAGLPTPLPLSGSADELAQLYAALPGAFQILEQPEGASAAAIKKCLKAYNASLPAPLKTGGSRDALLEQLAQIDPALADAERQKPQPLNTSGKKEELMASLRQIQPDARFADEILADWQHQAVGKIPVSQAQFAQCRAICDALLADALAGPLLRHPRREVEVSYFGLDDNTGLEIRVRPDVEIDTGHARIGLDLKSVSLGYVKQDNLRARLHREIIERDYHLSAGMYCDLAMLDQFFWIFVNKDPGYHWVALVEASPDELALGRLEYQRQLAAIRQAMDSNHWPGPIVDVITDELTDYEQRRLENLAA
ncbi:DNA breaking-rejoining protein [Edwardsiella tarda]|uniref:RecE family exodeoxyribonuclease n=1 Tax=Edwardsiella tarda TaxID=636 RepID=UPI00244489E8|nr:RecE family exodeoxyribonuclease [Edwardsiella tarda]WGE27686.1 DNA breaking-rejoining protein [Edwardsiella tarda]